MLARGIASRSLRHILPTVLLLCVRLFIGAVLTLSALLVSVSVAGANFNHATSAALPLGLFARDVGATGLGTTPTSTPTPTATCPPGPGTVGVIIENYTFLPQSITVTAGSTVTWSNYDGAITHTSTSDTAVWDSGPLSNGQSFQYTFNTPGTYPYYCTVHPDTMHGTVNVVAGCTPTSTPTLTFTRTRTITPTSTPTASCTPVTRSVMMADFVYNPQIITVTQGSTISWWNEGPSAHTSTSDTGAWDSGNVNPGGTFQFTFGSPGAYPYHCTLHPQMLGTIIVTDCGLPTPTLTPSCPLQWGLVSSPNVGTDDNHLLDMAAVSASDIWAVGYYFNGFVSQTLVEHWNGTSWSVVPSPNVGTGTSILHGVAAVSANDVWAVGYTGTQTLIEHWNGTQWSIVSSPNVGTGTNGLMGVAVVSPNDIWAIGHYYASASGAYRTLVEHWNGGYWSVVSSPNVGTGNNFLWGGLTALSASDIWAVGSFGPSSSGQTLALHWNGTVWSVVPTPNVGTSENRLQGVVALAANDVWAVGFYGNYQSEQTLVEHWDGTAWSIVPSANPGARNELLDISAASSSDVWAVGFSGGSTLGTLTEHWNGTQWSAAPSPSQPGTNVLEAVTAVSDSYVWASGEYQNNNLYRTLTLRYTFSGNGCPTATATRTVTSTPTRTPTPACPPVIRSVYMINFQYQPQTITITQGSTISWFNEGPYTHTTTSDIGVWNSGTLNPGQSYQFIFNTPGTYPYHCAIHPTMTGTITVTNCEQTATPTLTPTITTTPTATPILVGHVIWEGRPAQPNQLQVLPITLTLKMGATERNYSTQLTDQYGFFTVTLGRLPNGLYNWRADDSASALHSPNYLANSGTVSLTGAPTIGVEMGLMRAGDANNDNIVNITDFSVLKGTFGKSVGDPGYDDRADFTGDQTINVSDFNLLKLHFGQGGAPPIMPDGRLEQDPTPSPSFALIGIPDASPTGTPGGCRPWEVISSPNVITASQNLLFAVSSASATDVWAAGVWNHDTTSEALIEHWDGFRWSIVPGLEDNKIPLDIGAMSANDVWVVGTQSSPGSLIGHWNGAGWSLVPHPDPGNFLNTFEAVAATSANDVWAVGQYENYDPYVSLPSTLIEHWNGTDWRVVPSPDVGATSQSLPGVAAIASDDAWAVGYYGTSSSDLRTLILHWNGSVWSVVPSPNLGAGSNKLESVAAVSANDIWAVGHYWSETERRERTLAMHWDGHAWSVVPSPIAGAGDNELDGVTAISGDNIWAVGGYFDVRSGRNLALIEHWDGSHWSIVPNPANGTRPPMLHAAAADHSGTVWAVGWFVEQNGPIRTLTMRYSGGVTFSDVQPSDYFYQAVNYLYCGGAISGYSDGTFGSYNPTTRGQLCKIVALAEGWTIDCPLNPHFNDLPRSSPFYCFVETAYEHNVVSGYGDSTFRPSDDVTRGQLTKVVVLAQGWQMACPARGHFSDVAPDNPFYCFVETAVGRNVVSGYGDGTFQPGDPATRGQISKIIYMGVAPP